MHMSAIPIGIREGRSYNISMTEKTKRCMVCGKPSELSICEKCKAEIQGEALNKKMKVEKKVQVGEEVLKKKKQENL